MMLSPEDPQAPDVAALLAAHLSFAHKTTRPDHVHALPAERLADPAVTLFGVRLDDGVLIGVGALRELDATHAEIKSMHVASSARGRGVGRAIVEHLLRVAAERGYRRVSLETGAGEPFAVARALYARVGFRRCAPFADYTDNPYSVCMTIDLASEAPHAVPST